MESLKYMYAMAFAVEEINRNSTLLPGVKLGYRIVDGCSRYPWALQVALSLVGGDERSCSLTASMPHSASYEQSGETSMIIISEMSFPQISYMASCPCLSDRLKFPNFFRTIPSDIYQARAMARLAIRFHWTWIGAVLVNNDYGHLAIQVYVFVLYMSPSYKVQIYIYIYIYIYIFYCSQRNYYERCQTDSTQNSSFHCKGDSDLLLVYRCKENISGTGQNKYLAISKVASGVLGVAIKSSTIPGFESYLRNLHPVRRPDDEFLREFWEKEFGCNVSSLAKESLQKASLLPCSGTESLDGVQHPFTDTSQLRVAYNVYLAVYAAAHALHSLLSCPNRDSPLRNISTCSSPNHIKPIEVKMFITVSSYPQEFLKSQYDLVNWQNTPEGPLKLVLIGRVDGFDVHLNESAIQWSTGSSQVPVSVCSESCPPGTRMATRKGEPVCCFDCIPCAEGEISNKTGSPHCERCPSAFWSNAKRTVCIPRQLDFLSFNETLGITLTTAAVSGATVTTAVFVVFVCYRQTPMVRANNSELSFLLLLSLKLCFLCSLVFIGRPSVWACRFQQAAFGISFVLCVSCLLVKTMVVLVVFRSARPGAEALMKWFGPGQQRGSVCLFTCIQVIICAIWLSLSPPVPQQDLGFQGSKVTLKCAMASVVGFSLVLGYIGFLACTCLLLAFLARKLPDNFNEAKLITFSMLIFCAVWVAFVPAYVSSPGKYVVAVEIFAILASSYGLLLCIFAPKCFIILLRPEKNTKKYLMAR
uniref:Olfactory receptor C family, r1 n=1 Tax=Seriola lalandi dorsalis TaxID=1841481 RepID=A0A3B4YNT5_SERLL